MNIFALALGASIGLLSWSLLTRLSYAIHDATSSTNLATKLGDPNSSALSKMLWWVAGASIIWLLFFGGACLHYATSDSSKQLLAWLFGGFATTPGFIAITTARGLRRFKQRNAKRAVL
jgi:uncharacterized membrane protein